MGYTIYYKTKEPLTKKEIVDVVQYLHDNYNHDILKIVRHTPTSIILDSIRNIAVESLVFMPSNDSSIDFAFCKTNRYQPEDKEIKRLLTDLQGIIHNKLEITCDDGYTYNYVPYGQLEFKFK